MTQAHTIPDYRTVHLQGTPELIGQTQAALLHPVDSPFRRNPWEKDLPFLRACALLVRAVHGPLWDELEAFAAALDLPAEQALFVRAGARRQGCSSFVWHTSDGRVVAGRNYDFHERMTTRHLLVTTPRHGYAHVGMNGGLVGGRYDGVNEHGLFVALHKVMAHRPDSTRPGVPYHLLPRVALELCRNAEEAASLLSRLPQLASFNYTLADAQGNLFALECYPGERVRVRRSQGSIAVTNHYVSPALAPLQGRRNLEHSKARAQALRPFPPSGSDAWEEARLRLADHAIPLCAHKEFHATLWSGLFDLTNRRVAYAWGPPCTTAYAEVAWPGSSFKF